MSEHDPASTQVATPPLIHSATDPLWARLRGTRFVTVEVETEAQSRRDGGSEGLDGVAEGEVEWVTITPDQVTWRERGEWTAGRLKGTRYSSAYTWHRTGEGRLAISHLRLGPDHPVELVDLVATDAGRWRSATPHRCAEDRYWAEVWLEGHDVVVRWMVAGPTTGYLLTATYTAHAPV